VENYIQILAFFRISLQTYNAVFEFGAPGWGSEGPSSSLKLKNGYILKWKIILKF